MWNSWMDKAKVMAATIDKQLNESVGLDVADATATTTSTQQQTATDTVASSSEFDIGGQTTTTSSKNSTTNNNNNDDDAWNEDFDDDAFDEIDVNDDNDNVDDEKNYPDESDAPLQTTIEKKVEESSRDNDDEDDAAINNDNIAQSPLIEEETTATMLDVQEESAADPEILPTTTITEEASAPSEPPVVAEQLDEEPQPDAAETTEPSATETITESDEEQEPPEEEGGGEGWNQDEDIAFDGEDDNNEDDDDNENENDEENVDEPEPEETDKEQPTEASFPEGHEDEKVTNNIQQTTTVAAATATTTAPTSPSKPKLPSLSAATSMFSSFGAAAAVTAKAKPPPALSSFFSAATSKLAEVTKELDGHDTPSGQTLNERGGESGWNDEAAYDDDDVFDMTEGGEEDEIVPAAVTPSTSTLDPSTEGAINEHESTLDAKDQSSDQPQITTPPMDENIGLSETTKSREMPAELTPMPSMTTATPAVADGVESVQKETDPSSSTLPAHYSPTTNIEEDPRYQELKKQLSLREDQLASKSEQLAQLQGMWETQEQELRQKIHDTKEEAKKRIMRAKERCEAAEGKLAQFQQSGNESSAKQAHLIAELRAEGEKLAMKQSKMEQAVRAAKAESRELAARLEEEMNIKVDALEKIAHLEAELKSTKEALVSARKGESQAGHLENELLSARSDAERKGATIMSLQQQVKELTAEGKELREEIEKARTSAAQAAQQEKKTLRREHNDIIADLEQKLRTTEREAGVREDALRHEVTELRKRWQDAVRRADALSMDVQSSTAPLLRQLESMERQGRARAAGWAELENRLRSELEETVIQNETLSKERSEYKTKCTRLERAMKDIETEASKYKTTIDEQTDKITKLETKVEQLEAEAEKRQEEYVKVERLANEGVMRVRSEMTQTVVDSEERYRGQIQKLEAELKVEKEKRTQLEKQVEQLLENSGMMLPPQAPEAIRAESKPKKLRQAEGQAAILAGALGFESDDDDDDDDDAFMENGMMDRGDGVGNSGGGSFAALEHLSSRLKAATVELEALRKNLRQSEQEKESLVKELGESLTAKEKLPLFEAKVKELAADNQEKELEIQGLRDDIADVKELYRTQLNVLLEEKATLMAAMNGAAASSPPQPTTTTTTNGEEQLKSEAGAVEENGDPVEN